MHTMPALIRFMLPIAAVLGAATVAAAGARETRRQQEWEEIESRIERARAEGHQEGLERGHREGVAQGFVMFVRQAGAQAGPDEREAMRYVRHLRSV